MGVVDLVQKGSATKKTYDDALITYRWPTGKVDVKGVNITIYNQALHPDDPQALEKMTYTNITTKFGTSNAEELVDYWMEHDFFLGDDKVTSVPFAIKITSISKNEEYIGKAVPGSVESAAVWQCQKIEKIGLDETITWADGDDNFDNVATDLTTLTYS